MLFVDKSTPETVKLCGATVQPEHEVNVFKVPVAVKTGLVAAVKLTDALLVPFTPFNV